MAWHFLCCLFAVVLCFDVAAEFMMPFRENEISGNIRWALCTDVHNV